MPNLDHQNPEQIYFKYLEVRQEAGRQEVGRQEVGRQETGRQEAGAESRPPKSKANLLQISEVRQVVDKRRMERRSSQSLIYIK